MGTLIPLDRASNSPISRPSTRIRNRVLHGTGTTGNPPGIRLSCNVPVLATRFRIDPDDIIDVKAEVVDAGEDSKPQKGGADQGRRVVNPTLACRTRDRNPTL